MASRGMGAINQSKMPGKKTMRRKDGDKFDDNGVTKHRRDGNKFIKYAGGGNVKSAEPMKELSEAPMRELVEKPSLAKKAFKKVRELAKRSSEPRVLPQTPMGLPVVAAYETYKRGTGTAPLEDDLKKIQTARDFDPLEDIEPIKKAKGGKVNEAGNYTKPELRKRIVSQVKAAATQGTGAGQWSGRKAQLVAKKYKAAGGGYRD